MNKKKIIWIVLLVAFISIVTLVVMKIKPKDTENKTTSSVVSRNSASGESKNSEEKQVKVTKTELEDGTLYSFTDEEIIPDIVLTDNYFDTTINDMMLNYNTYKGKKIQIEGMYMESGPYTFVGRYSTSNICATCPQGYSYMEYILQDKIDANLVDEDTWIKVIGTFSRGRDATSNFEDYYYLKVLSIEVMNEKGQETVNN